MGEINELFKPENTNALLAHPNYEQYLKSLTIEIERHLTSPLLYIYHSLFMTHLAFQSLDFHGFDFLNEPFPLISGHGAFFSHHVAQSLEVVHGARKRLRRDRGEGGGGGGGGGGRGSEIQDMQ